MSKEGDDGGPLQQRKWSICMDSPHTASALQVPSLRSLDTLLCTTVSLLVHNCKEELRPFLDSYIQNL